MNDRLTKKNFFLKSVGIPSDRNVMRTEDERKFRYQNVNVEIQRTWVMTCFVIRTVTDPQELLTKSYKKYVEIIPVKL
jgi:hypothetical protein